MAAMKAASNRAGSARARGVSPETEPVPSNKGAFRRFLSDELGGRTRKSQSPPPADGASTLRGAGGDDHVRAVFPKPCREYATMPIYRLDGRSPVLPMEGRFFIAPDAHVVGNVHLGEDVGIWFGAVIRGDNEPIVVGARTNIQEGAMLHTDPGFPISIGQGCTIGHHAIVHGAKIGDNTLIGMGATVLNGACIGANCLVGAGALVTERKEFPDNSLIVGAPAKAVRQLDKVAIAGLRRSAEIYVANYRRFLSGFERIG